MIAEKIAKALGGPRAGSAWACCPARDDREPSLAITDARDGKVLLRCHAGCDQQDVIAALRARGAWENRGQGAGRFLRKADRREPDRDALKRTEAALAVWRASHPAEGTPVERVP
jgi:putative DNA primase/helicase